MTHSLAELIHEKRPHLTAGSIKTYSSILSNLHKKVFEPPFNLEDFTHVKPIMDYLKDVPANKRKTILSALVVICGDDKYRAQMMTDIHSTKTDTDKQTKNEKQEANWIQPEQIQSIYDSLKRNADLIYKKAQLSPTDLQQIQSFLLLALSSGLFIPPRRSLDWCDLKIKAVDKAKDNYIDKTNFVFNSYKNSGTKGQQSIEIPKPLKSILTKWIKTNPTEYFFFDLNGNKLTNVKINQRLNKIFDGRKISTSMLRHVYLSSKYADTIKRNKELAQDLHDMGSSAAQETTYIKS